MAAPDAESIIALAGIAAGGTLLMGVAAWMASKARAPKKRVPPRRTFDHGRRLGRLRVASTPQEAVEALKGAPVGEVVRASAGEERADVVLRRRKSQPCEQAAGFLAGVFERAWARDVMIEHPVCAGKSGDCAYAVLPVAGPTFNANARPAEGASTRRSEDARRPDPRARRGGV